jgi:hypothetical protein
MQNPVSHSLVSQNDSASFAFSSIRALRVFAGVFDVSEWFLGVLFDGDLYVCRGTGASLPPLHEISAKAHRTGTIGLYMLFRIVFSRRYAVTLRERRYSPPFGQKHPPRP